ncbi:F-box domain, Leucine-rich repeat domain, L domain-like protein [Artemisia annua]|uniref:F-box domain, Leucine-rich repeat domain, L domain-like protein n=1 Tax=Artemisia annua TaxID=35608 RepID=A0A2U1NSE1_ARTAN|nr:F-box domain, Leucine-rich repeat domain, L domain-like protein [Artemisia annua]
MDRRRDTKRANVEVDRLSSLPNDLIHKILSLNGLKCAIGNSVLSSRWRYIWTSMPCLDFSCKDFSTLPKFLEYIANVLSRRNNLVQVFSIKFCFIGDFNQAFVQQVLSYAFSHSIQQLSVTCLLDDRIQLPLSLFNSQSLKHLTLTSELIDGSFETFCKAHSLTTASTLSLPSLTTLYLADVTLCNEDNNDQSVGIFSECPNLKNLIIDSIKVKGSDVLHICHHLLSDLTLKCVKGSLNGVNVVAPQLKNLNIRHYLGKDLQYRISAPDLSSLRYNGYHPMDLFTKGFSSLEKVYLGVYSENVAYAHRMLRLLQQLQSVKFLTLSIEIIEILSSSVELISGQPSPFTNLNMLKIYPEKVDLKEQAQKKANMSMEVKNYLLDGSPSTTFILVSREEKVAEMRTKSAQKQMDNLRVRLEREIANLEINMSPMNRGKTLTESDKAIMQEQHIAELEYLTHIEETMTCIDASWEDLNSQIERGKSRISGIISDLHDIKEVMIKLPASNKAELQPRFSSLCSEADIVVNKIMDYVKILCDMKGSRFSVYIHGLATASLQSF